VRYPSALATLRSSSPSGERWQYELKFAGYRVQLHKSGAVATIFSKNGADFTRRFPTIAAAVRVRSAVRLDQGEATAGIEVWMRAGLMDRRSR
jgi:ATP-dependent DNA ligase